ncbi:MAG TPA: hypothetical protein VFG21_10375 [Xanthomonadaceae bacterium]|nr:hypothetical protein [Xanthomonadaceae bacterium]
MRRHQATHIAAIALLAAAVSAPAGANVAQPEPVYEPGSHYTATLHLRSGQWQLQPLDGQDLTVSVPEECAPSAGIPAGVWLLVQRGDGELALRAPSTTALPAGHAGEVALRDCASAPDGTSLRAPAQLIEWLAATTGAVYVDD